MRMTREGCKQGKAGEHTCYRCYDFRPCLCSDYRLWDIDGDPEDGILVRGRDAKDAASYEFENYHGEHDYPMGELEFLVQKSGDVQVHRVALDITQSIDVYATTVSIEQHATWH